MGLGPIQSIYKARFVRYLEDRGLKKRSDSKVWAFVGDGETDEPETLGAITLASREKLDNLIFVINCNLQRLDGPVRGNGQIIQELEAIFRGAGWNVIKCIWGSEWDVLLEKTATNRPRSGPVPTAPTASTRRPISSTANPSTPIVAARSTIGPPRGREHVGAGGPSRPDRYRCPVRVGPHLVAGSHSPGAIRA
jgi:hypothetical protein